MYARTQKRVSAVRVNGTAKLHKRFLLRGRRRVILTRFIKVQLDFGTRKSCRVFAAALVAALWLSPSIVPPARAQTAASESDVKAAFIFNFLKFTQWPAAAFASNSEPILVCVQAGGDLDGPINTLSNRTVQNRTIQVRRVPAGDSEAPCHVKYFGASVVGASRDLLAKRSVVTIGDAPRFAETGGIVNFYRSDGRLRFEINVQAARQANIYFSADLLRLARIVSVERAQ